MLNLSENKLDNEAGIEQLYSSRLLNTPCKFNIIRRWMLGILCFIIACMFLPWQQNVQGYGKITPFMPQDRPQSVNSILAGRIEKWNVREGQQVNKGDTLLIISEVKEKFFDPQILARTNNQIENKIDAVKSKQEKINALQKQVDALKSGLNFKLQQAKNKVKQFRFKVQAEKADYDAAKLNQKLSEDQFARLEKLYNQGLASLTELQNRTNKNQEAQAKLISAENKYNTALQELINSEIELNSIEADYLDKISKVESDLSETAGVLFESQADIAKMRIEYSNLQTRSDLYIIRAPQDGFVVKALKAGIGETIKEGEEVVSILPATAKLAVELYVKAVDLPLLHEDCKVRLQFDGWPALVFSGWSNASVGTFGGVVKVIDKVNSANGKFRILITPDPDDVAWPELIRAGSGVYGWAMLNNVMLGYELWRQFNGFPPDMVKNIESIGNGNSKTKEDKKTDE